MKYSTKTCSREGCDGEVRGRGMCGTHYCAWRRAQVSIPGRVSAEDLVIEEMPGTLRELAARTGLCYDTVRVAVRMLHIREWINVCSILPPGQEGGQWRDVFDIGQGEDARVSKWKKHQYALRSRRQRRIENAERKELAAECAKIPPMDPLVGALFGMAA